MSVLSQMKSMEKEMSATEKKIYAFIRENIEKAASMTANEIAKASGASAPTVVRFSKKMGYQSLTDLKISLSAEAIQDVDPDHYNDVQPNESFHSLKNKLASNASYTINHTTNLFNETEFVAACELLETKDFCYVAGIGASNLAVTDIVQKWTRLGKAIFTANDYNSLLPQLVTHREKTILWLVSNSGLTPELVALATSAKELGIPVLTLTQFGQNALTKLADVALQTSRPKEAHFRSAATDSIIAQFITIDVLFYFYISRNPAHQETIYRTREVIDAYRQKNF